MTMRDSKVSKSYVRPDNTAVLTCPKCHQQKVILADKFKGPRHKLTIKCLCQNVFTAYIEFRKRVRKKVILRGTYINHTQKDISGVFYVENISVTGLALSRVNVENFKVADELSLKFALDDEQQTEFKKKAIVRSVREYTIGCEFEQYEDDFGSPLGHYITYEYI